MAITIEHLRQVLDSAQIHYQPYDETTLLTVFSWEELRLDLVCSLWEEGEYLDVRTVGLAHLDPEDEEQIQRVLPRISRVNYDYKLARVAWEEGGELTVGAALPVEDRTRVTADQVAAMITAVCQAASEIREDLAEPVEAEQAPAEVQPPAGQEDRLVGLGRLLLGLGVFMLGLAALLASLALWVR